MDAKSKIVRFVLHVMCVALCANVLLAQKANDGASLREMYNRLRTEYLGSEPKFTLDYLTFSGGNILIGDLSKADLPKGIRTGTLHLSSKAYYPSVLDTIWVKMDKMVIYKGNPEDFSQINLSFENWGEHEIHVRIVRKNTVLYRKKLGLQVPYLFKDFYWLFYTIGCFIFFIFYTQYKRKKYYKQLNTETQARLAITEKLNIETMTRLAITEEKRIIAETLSAESSARLALAEEKRSILEMLNEQQTLLARLRVNALSNQLKPHFLKNSLHLIQTKVVDDHPEVAEVIKRFAQSLTIVVECSDSVGLAMNTLGKEIQLAENYLYMQKMLFPKRLQYKITGSELLETYGNLLVPLMSVQIFVENAAYHGIENKIEGGAIVISIRERDRYLEIEVDDEGVGFEEAARIGTDKNRKSTGRGIKMLDELFEILNHQNEDPIFHKVTHKTHPDGSAAGVTVLISFPKKIRHDTK